MFGMTCSPPKLGLTNSCCFAQWQEKRFNRPNFPQQMSLFSALQPNKWTWQICYQDTKPASNHYAVTNRLHFGGIRKLFGAASFANRECASNPHVSTGSCTMTCARCSWQWPPIPNAAARSYAAELFQAFQCATWNLQRSWATPPFHETPAQGRSISSSSGDSSFVDSVVPKETKSWLQAVRIINGHAAGAICTSRIPWKHDVPYLHKLESPLFKHAMQSVDGPVITQLQMCWVASTAWLCNSLGPSPSWLNMISGFRNILTLSSGYQRCSILKDMLLAWKVNVGELALGNTTCFVPTSKRHIFFKLCWHQLQEQRETSIWWALLPLATRVGHGKWLGTQPRHILELFNHRHVAWCKKRS